jgi:hypothetical protein
MGMMGEFNPMMTMGTGMGGMGGGAAGMGGVAAADVLPVWVWPLWV